MWLYGMVQFQRHENRSLIANAGISRPSATPHRCTEAPTGNHWRYTWPTSVTQKGFSTFLVNSRKRGFLYSRQKSYPTLLEWTFPKHSIWLKVLLEKRHQSLRGEPRGS